MESKTSPNAQGEDAARPSPLWRAVRWLFRLALLAVGAALLICGVMMLRGRRQALRELEAMARWRVTPATVLSADLQTQRLESDHAPQALHRIQARYAYTYGGRRYESARVRVVDDFSDDPNLPRLQQELARRRDSGEPITCYVNPDDPKQATLSRELPESLYFQPLLWSGFLSLMGLIFLWAFLRPFVEPLFRRSTRLGRS